MYLLDVNVLIALIDPNHEHHIPALHFFDTARMEGWATCSLTENRLMRILGHPAYPNGTHSLQTARKILNLLCAQPGHQFWTESISLRDETKYPTLPASKHLTDFYLLALAAEHKGILATFDRRIDPKAVLGGTEACQILSR